MAAEQACREEEEREQEQARLAEEARAHAKEEV